MIKSRSQVQWFLYECIYGIASDVERLVAEGAKRRTHRFLLACRRGLRIPLQPTDQRQDRLAVVCSGVMDVNAHGQHIFVRA
jgi:hypothetical protein